MATSTTVFDLVKPDPLDNYDIAVQNSNMDKIEAGLVANLMSYAGTGTDTYGAMRMGNGTRIQWRSQQITVNSGTITFPEAFSNTDYTVVATMHVTQGNNLVVGVRAKRINEIDFFTTWISGGVATVQVIAIGR